jgi:hypothetical protein
MCERIYGDAVGSEERKRECNDPNLIMLLQPPFPATPSIRTLIFHGRYPIKSATLRETVLAAVRAAWARRAQYSKRVDQGTYSQQQRSDHDHDHTGTYRRPAAELESGADAPTFSPLDVERLEKNLDDAADHDDGPQAHDEMRPRHDLDHAISPGSAP